MAIGTKPNGSNLAPRCPLQDLHAGFLQDDGCGKSYEGVSVIGRVAELKMLHFVNF
jgi:hypothetical protein